VDRRGCGAALGLHDPRRQRVDAAPDGLRARGRTSAARGRLAGALELERRVDDGARAVRLALDRVGAGARGRCVAPAARA
jgi:hypothetical protein